jgi:hypothetical protein
MDEPGIDLGRLGTDRVVQITPHPADHDGM